jgi:iron(III) transport system permease protein
MMAKATSSGGARALPAGRAWLCTGLFAGITFLAVLPHLGVILVAFAEDWYGTVLPTRYTLENFELALGHDLTVSAIANSLRFASISAVIDIVLGVAIAYVVVRSRIAGRQVLDFLAMLPLAVPGLVLAFGYLAMAQEAAQNLGCPPLKAMIKVTLPLIAANLIAGGLLAFAFAMLEVSDSLILAQKQAYYPITKAILELFQLLGDGKFIASALGVWAMVFLGVTIAGLSLLLGRRLGALFRV